MEEDPTTRCALARRKGLMFDVLLFIVLISDNIVLVL